MTNGQNKQCIMRLRGKGSDRINDGRGGRNITGEEGGEEEGGEGPSTKFWKRLCPPREVGPTHYVGRRHKRDLA